MQYILTPKSKNTTGHCWWDNAFNNEELDTLQKLASEQNKAALVGGSDSPVEDVRRSQVGWLSCTPEFSWVYDKIAEIVSQLNAAHYHFDLVGFGEPLQLTNYSYENLGTYKWHQDFGSAGVSRKLSVIVQLSDPNEYEGGTIQLLTKSDPVDIEKKRGLVTVFPAWMLHQVTPVTKGTRQSLVSWITGPAFK
jgi:PKHD-type hydroxylase